MALGPSHPGELFDLEYECISAYDPTFEHQGSLKGEGSIQEFLLEKRNKTRCVIYTILYAWKMTNTSFSPFSLATNERKTMNRLKTELGGWNLGV